MSLARSHAHGELNFLYQEMSSLRDELYKIHERMKKQENYCPNVQELDRYAERIGNFISKNHKYLNQNKQHLMNAIVDLTEIPVMHPKMQRIAIYTAIKVACDNIEKFGR
ncbi:MAG: hypothetical protein EBZ47_03405 [Chlamydiae bacterium]|nr:hypothetical protein [Chlamydiota bacterium]